MRYNIVRASLAYDAPIPQIQNPPLDVAQHFIISRSRWRHRIYTNAPRHDIHPARAHILRHRIHALHLLRRIDDDRSQPHSAPRHDDRRRAVHVHVRVQARDEEQVRRAIVVICGVGRVGVDEDGMDGLGDDGRSDSVLHGQGRWSWWDTGRTGNLEDKRMSYADIGSTR